MDPLPRRKPPRHSREELAGVGLGFFTACMQCHVPPDRQREGFPVLIGTLYRAAERHHCRVDAYCFMPDHCHLLLQGLDETADAWMAVVKFKRDTGVWLDEHRGHGQWQRGFHSDIVDPNDEPEAVAWYIVNNPVRKGLVEDWRDYPYSGMRGYRDEG
ncbi:MAG: transposase [Armatimonadetes bacterium]|nr:transposase [Armatimonadota bacterium]